MGRKSKIEPPAIWYDLGLQVHQDFHLTSPDFVGGLLHMLQCRAPEAIDLLRVFLHRILTEETDLGRCKYWAMAKPMVYFDPTGLSLMLTELLERISDPAFTSFDYEKIGTGRSYN